MHAQLTGPCKGRPSRPPHAPMHACADPAPPPSPHACAKGMAVKGLLEHACTYPDHGARRCHLFLIAHAFGPDPVLSRVLAVRG
jgi:hypothetical protein